MLALCCLVCFPGKDLFYFLWYILWKAVQNIFFCKNYSLFVVDFLSYDMYLYATKQAVEARRSRNMRNVKR